MGLRPRCRYCNGAIAKARRDSAKRAGVEPSFCANNHSVLFHQRKRRLVESGVEGEALEKALRAAAKAYKPRRKLDDTQVMEPPQNTATRPETSPIPGETSDSGEGDVLAALDDLLRDWS